MIRTLVLMLVLLNCKNLFAVTVGENYFNPQNSSTETGVSGEVKSNWHQSREFVLNTYFFGASYLISDQLMAEANINMLTGRVGNQTLNEFSDPEINLRWAVAKLHDGNPLWLIFLAQAMPMTSEKSKFSDQYQEYSGGISLAKRYRKVDFNSEGIYRFKIQEPAETVDVGNEMNLSTRLTYHWGGGFRSSLGYLFRHADPVKKNGELEVGEGIYSGILAHLEYEFMPSMSLSAEFLECIGDREGVIKNRRAFGNLVSQAQLGRSMSVSFNLGF